MKKEKGLRGVIYIGIFKLACAVLLFLAAGGIFRLLDANIGETLTRLVLSAHLDPENRLIERVLAFLAGMDAHRLRLIDAGTFFYGLLQLVEGIGLIRGKHWAEYLTIFATSSLIPFELYEIMEKPGTVRFLVLLINLLIVAYLLWQLHASRKRRAQAT